MELSISTHRLLKIGYEKWSLAKWVVKVVPLDVNYHRSTKCNLLHPKLNIATMLDDSIAIPKGVMINLGWLGIFYSLMDIMDESLYIASIISIDLYSCIWT